MPEDATLKEALSAMLGLGFRRIAVTDASGVLARRGRDSTRSTACWRTATRDAGAGRGRPHEAAAGAVASCARRRSAVAAPRSRGSWRSPSCGRRCSRASRPTASPRSTRRARLADFVVGHLQLVDRQQCAHDPRRPPARHLRDATVRARLPGAHRGRRRPRPDVPAGGGARARDAGARASASRRRSSRCSSTACSRSCPARSAGLESVPASVLDARAGWGWGRRRRCCASSCRSPRASSWRHPDLGHHQHRDRHGRRGDRRGRARRPHHRRARRQPEPRVRARGRDPRRDARDPRRRVPRPGRGASLGAAARVPPPRPRSGGRGRRGELDLQPALAAADEDARERLAVDRSTNVRSRLRWPNGLMPPVTYPGASSPRRPASPSTRVFAPRAEASARRSRLAVTGTTATTSSPVSSCATSVLKTLLGLGADRRGDAPRRTCPPRRPRDRRCCISNGTPCLFRNVIAGVMHATSSRVGRLRRESTLGESCPCPRRAPPPVVRLPHDHTPRHRTRHRRAPRHAARPARPCSRWCSGGADSTALLRLLASGDARRRVALSRPARRTTCCAARTSDADAAFVAALCARARRRRAASCATTSPRTPRPRASTSRTPAAACATASPRRSSTRVRGGACGRRAASPSRTRATTASRRSSCARSPARAPAASRRSRPCAAASSARCSTRGRADVRRVPARARAGLARGRDERRHVAPAGARPRASSCPSLEAAQPALPRRRSRARSTCSPTRTRCSPAMADGFARRLRRAAPTGEVAFDRALMRTLTRADGAPRRARGAARARSRRRRGSSPRTSRRSSTGSAADALRARPAGRPAGASTEYGRLVVSRAGRSRAVLAPSLLDDTRHRRPRRGRDASSAEEVDARRTSPATPTRSSIDAARRRGRARRRRGPRRATGCGRSGMAGTRKLSDLLVGREGAAARAAAARRWSGTGERHRVGRGSADERGVPGDAGDDAGRAADAGSARRRRAERRRRDDADAMHPDIAGDHPHRGADPDARRASSARQISARLRGRVGPARRGAARRGAVRRRPGARDHRRPSRLDFMAVSSYGSSTKSSGVVRILKDLDETIEGRNVLVVEDILDTGLTLKYLLKNLASRKPRVARGRRAAEQGGQAAGTYRLQVRRVSTSPTSSSSDTVSTSPSGTATCRTSGVLKPEVVRRLARASARLRPRRLVNVNKNVRTVAAVPGAPGRAGRGSSWRSWTSAPTASPTALHDERVRHGGQGRAGRRRSPYVVRDSKLAGHVLGDREGQGRPRRSPSAFTSTYVGHGHARPSSMAAATRACTYTVDASGPSPWITILSSVLPILLLVFVMFFFLNQMQGGNSQDHELRQGQGEAHDARPAAHHVQGRRGRRRGRRGARRRSRSSWPTPASSRRWAPRSPRASCS